MSDNPHNLPWTWDKSRFTICDSRGMRIFDAPKIHLVENLELVVESVNSHALLQKENARLREVLGKIVNLHDNNYSVNALSEEIEQAKQALKEGE